MVTSDFRPEVEIRPIRACAMKNTQYNPYLFNALLLLFLEFRGNRGSFQHVTTAAGLFTNLFIAFTLFDCVNYST